MKLRSITISLVLLMFDKSITWSVYPQIPLGHQPQFLIFGDGGSYGHYISEGPSPRQTSGAYNQVIRHYFYKSNTRQHAPVKDTIGIQKFIEPINGFSNTENREDSNLHLYSKNTFLPTVDPTSIENSVPDSRKKEEELVSTNNTQILKDQSGSINPKSTKRTPHISKPSKNIDNNVVSVLNSDGSFYFSYTDGTSSRTESRDVNNNVQGKYSYTDDAGTHDLTYAARKNTGFHVTGGSLAIPNGLRNIHSSAPESPIFYSVPFESPPHNDSSYSFEYSTPVQSRQEIGDNKGNVYGGYSFVNEEGNHDLRYVAGSSTGFLPVGGSLLNSNSAHNQIPSFDSNHKSNNFGLFKNQKSSSENVNVVNNNEPIKHGTGNIEGTVLRNSSYKNALSSHRSDVLSNKSSTGEFLNTNSDFNKNQKDTNNSTRLSNIEDTFKNSVFPAIGHILLPPVVLHSYIFSLNNTQDGDVYGTLPA